MRHYRGLFLVAALVLLLATLFFQPSEARNASWTENSTVLLNELTIADASITEGDSGSANLAFSVTLTPSSTQTVMVDYFTSNGTATEPGDYTSTSGTLTFAPGQTTRTVSVPVNGDATPEGNETLFVNLMNPTDATISDAQGIGTINDNDSTNIFQFSAPTVIASENASAVTLNVTRTGNASGAATLNFETSDGTASQKGDYTFGSGMIQFGPGDTSRTFQVLLVNDVFVEGSEMFLVTLSNPPVNSAVGDPGTVVVTILDDDSAPTTVNPIDDADFFVRQHYLDFLGREPDAAGLSFWTDQITSCGPIAACISLRRVNVSAAFFLSIEFQETSGNVIRTQRVAFGRQSNDAALRVPYLQFMRDTRRVGAGVIVGQPGFQAVLEQNKQDYALQIVTSSAFLARFPIAPAGLYVDALFASAGVMPTTAERDAAINAFGAGGSAGRVAALRSVADSDSVRLVEFRTSFVLAEYYGYLRRNPTDLPDLDDAGYQFWLAKLNSFNGDFVAAEMVKAFLLSIEYRGRFGP